MTTTPTPTPSPVFADDHYWWDATGSGTITHQPGAEETVCGDTLPTLLIPADHPDSETVIEQLMERAFRDALPDPGFPWTTVGTTAAVTLFVVAAAFAGWRFIQSRRAARPAHAVTPAPTEAD